MGTVHNNKLLTNRQRALYSPKALYFRALYSLKTFTYSNLWSFQVYKQFKPKNLRGAVLLWKKLHIILETEYS